MGAPVRFVLLVLMAVLSSPALAQTGIPLRWTEMQGETPITLMANGWEWKSFTTNDAGGGLHILVKAGRLARCAEFQRFGAGTTPHFICSTLSNP